MEYTFNIKYLGNFLLLIRDAMNPLTEKKNYLESVWRAKLEILGCFLQWDW